jgi:hypothetical protein
MPLTSMPRRSGGSDWRTIHVMRIDQETGESERLSDKLENVKFSSMAWTHDNKACNRAAAWRLSLQNFLFDMTNSSLSCGELHDVQL